MLDNENGFGTVEMVLLLAIMLGLALLFKGTVVKFVNGILGQISSTQISISNLK